MHNDETLVGRMLGFDLGEKRIGLAISDPLRITARPLQVVQRTSRRNDFAIYQQIIAEHDISALVVGLPTHLDGRESPMSAWVRDYAAEMAQKLDLPLFFHDEHHTTDDARRRMIDLGYNRQKREKLRDAVAAAIILQDYLDLLDAIKQQSDRQTSP